MLLDRSCLPPTDSMISYEDMVMGELEQMRTELNAEREYRTALQFESSRVLESKLSLPVLSLGQIVRPSGR